MHRLDGNDGSPFLHALPLGTHSKEQIPQVLELPTSILVYCRPSGLLLNEIVKQSITTRPTVLKE